LSLQSERLLSLLNFAKESILLRTKPAASLSQSGLFVLLEDEIVGLPGVHLNVDDDDDEVWLKIERLSEIAAPLLDSELLRTWIRVESSPTTEPHLLRQVELEGQEEPEEGLRALRLDEYELEDEIREGFEAYLNGPWRDWAEQEKRRRQTISLYSPEAI